jgi:hypothetical protein
MARFAIFVDGSNMFGAFKSMNLEVKDYEALFGYVFKESSGDLDRCKSPKCHEQWGA